MINIVIPKDLKVSNQMVTKEQVEAYFAKGGKAPSIKTQMVLKAFEITSETKVLFDNQEVIVLYSVDHTGAYITCFNKQQEEVTLELPLEVLKINKVHRAYCVLSAEELGTLNNTLRLTMHDNGVLLVKVTPE